MRLIYISLIILLWSKSYSKDLEPQSFVLPNGIKVVLIENNRAPVVTQMAWYNVGSIDEPYGKSGIAHFLEHLMFKGTKKYKNNFFSNFISKNGGSENAFTSFDYTAYYQTVPSEFLEDIIKMEADRMKNLLLTNNQVQTEKKVILEERYQRIDSDSSSLLDESMQKVLFPNSTYGTPIIGWKHEIDTLSFDDVKQFYKTFYQPENLILVYSGNIDKKKLMKLTRKYFGKIYNLSRKNHRLNLVDPELKTNIRVELIDKESKQRIWKRFYKTYSYVDSVKKGIALDLGLKILAGGTTSILYDELVKKKKVVSAIGGYYNGLTRGDGVIYFYAVPNEKINLLDLEVMIDENIKDAINKKITKEMFLIEKKKYFYDSIYLMDSISQPAQIVGEALSVGLELSEIKNWNNYLEEITFEEVKKELNNFKYNKSFVTGILK
ncbi:MAG: peptidase M16 [Rickettsiales bacterium]|nr:peptidase M16 [Rickettsiales bacterium]OUV53278.1 MAG: hypothetical protein CBC87_05255 [Rickettsiales bacterium TMED127]